VPEPREGRETKAREVFASGTRFERSESLDANGVFANAVSEGSKDEQSKSFGEYREP
jgi:hypothetical protein